MKKMNLNIIGFFLLASFTACTNDNTTASTTTTDSTTVKSVDTSNGMNNNAPATTTPTYSKMPLSKDDSMFVMKAAMGGMMEVDAGNLAQQNAANDRVKDFGMMLVKDHSKANAELTSIAAAKGLTVPATVNADMKKKEEEMAKMKGKSFDSHYMSMMLTDHKKDIADFEKAASSANDPDLKAFADKTLPVLKMHLDSAQAISKMHM
ncbi:MAG: DUF4142 domain-containing protein [Bacteroidota bacterium]|nr:DUF4142 domain-containing protein [Bacteroidota bacterium]